MGLRQKSVDSQTDSRATWTPGTSGAYSTTSTTTTTAAHFSTTTSTPHSTTYSAAAAATATLAMVGFKANPFQT
jgi:hypothetical protein